MAHIKELFIIDKAGELTVRGRIEMTVMTQRRGSDFLAQTDFPPLS